MEKITDYILAVGTNDNLGQLAKTVNDKIANGYQPFGNAFILPVGRTTQICQPMVRRRDNAGAAE
jgi:hypothetical protein